MDEAGWGEQLEAFEQQLRLAQELRRPVSVRSSGWLAMEPDAPAAVFVGWHFGGSNSVPRAHPLPPPSPALAPSAKQVHCVRAHGVLHDTLRRLRLGVPVVLHSWGGSADMTAALVQLPGVYVSLSGHLARLAPTKALPMVGGWLWGGGRAVAGRGWLLACALPCVVVVPQLWDTPIGKRVRFALLQLVAAVAHSHLSMALPKFATILCPALAQVRAVPLGRLLLESDCPDGVLELSPAWLEAVPALRGLPQQLEAAGLRLLTRPSVLRCTLQLVAAVRGCCEEEVATATSENARRVFCTALGRVDCTPAGLMAPPHSCKPPG